MLPAEILKRIPDEGEIIALRMRETDLTKDYYFKMWSKEGPNNLMDFSLGSASPQASAGTGWSEIQDSANRYILEPEEENKMYLIYYGISPSLARIYRRYPANVDRGSLIGTRTTTGAVGFIDGVLSPPHVPSSQTEFITLLGLHPAFFGYHPYLEPSTITVRMNFYVVVFKIEYLRSPTEEEKMKAVKRTMGGITLLETPSWVVRRAS